MDHSVNAKVIITLLDLYFFSAFFFSALCKHTPAQTDVHTHTHGKFSQMSRLPGVVLGG